MLNKIFFTAILALSTTASFGQSAKYMPMPECDPCVVQGYMPMPECDPCVTQGYMPMPECDPCVVS